MKKVILSILVLYSSTVVSMSEQAMSGQSSSSVIAQVISFFSWLGNKSKELEKIVKQDKAYKANINNKLLRACREGDLAMVKDTLAKGADLDATNAHNWTPFYIALYYRRKEIVNYLLSLNKYLIDSFDDKNTPESLTDFLFNNVIDKCTQIPQGLFESRFVSNFHYSINGEFLFDIPMGFEQTKTIIIPKSPLHFAVLEGQSQIVELLLRSGASTETRHVDGNTPLSHLFMEYTSFGLIRAPRFGVKFNALPVLLKYGANINCQKYHIRKALGLQENQKIYEYLKPFRDSVINQLSETSLLPGINLVIAEYIYGDKTLDADLSSIRYS